MKKNKKMYALYLSILMIAGLILVLSINEYVKKTGNMYILEMESTPKVDAIIVLGARIFTNGNVSLMLKDRLDVGYDLYMGNKAEKIIVSGDHGQKEYDEVNAMKQYLKEKNIPGEDIFMDHAGFSTYESLYRARDIFQVKKAIIVTQEYHLMRAVFIARELGIEAYGVSSDMHIYFGHMLKNELREIAARNKDFFNAKVLKPKPKYLGDVIPVTGDGTATND